MNPLNEDRFAGPHTLVLLQYLQPGVRIPVKDSDEDVVPEKVGHPFTLATRPAPDRCCHGKE